jgi:integrase/recombinase XerD
LDLSSSPAILTHARNIWLISFYFAGMRITDALMLRWTDFQKDRLFYTMSKNDEPGHLKIPTKAVAILDQYRNNVNAHGFVFPLLNKLSNLDDKNDLRRKINTADNRIGKAMKLLMIKIGSNKNASPHKARHAFAQRAEEKNVHPKVLQKMYRHESILTTMNYQSNFSHQKADEALDAVVGF